MLKFFAHCWLILSLLVVPVQFAAADVAVVDHAEMKCEMMDAGTQHDSGCGESCQDCGTCPVVGALLPINLSTSSHSVTSFEYNIIHSLSGYLRSTNFRPPRV